MSYGANMTAEHILRAHEEMDSLNHQYEGRDRNKVRKVTVEILQTFGHRNNLYDIKLDGWRWAIYYDGTLPFKERLPMEQLISEQL